MKRATVVLAACLTMITFGTSTPGSSAAQASARLSASSRLDRTVSVYAAVIRELVARSHGFGVSDTGVVYVLDGSVDGAEDPMRAANVHPRPFKPALKRRLRKALDELPAMQFVKDRAAVITGEAPGHVIDHGVLLTLGPIKGGRARMEVGSSLWVNGLAGQWQTYVVVPAGPGWKVAGTTGRMVIS